MWLLTIETRAPWGEREIETRAYRWRWLARLFGAMETTDDPTGQLTRTFRVERLVARRAHH